MSGFSIEQVYGCTRSEFCDRTGTNPEDIIIRLRKELVILEANLATVRVQFIHGGQITDDDQRERAKLIKVIESKIERKSGKIRDIENSLRG